MSFSKNKYFMFLLLLPVVLVVMFFMPPQRDSEVDIGGGDLRENNFSSDELTGSAQVEIEIPLNTLPEDWHSERAIELKIDHLAAPHETDKLSVFLMNKGFVDLVVVKSIHKEAYSVIFGHLPEFAKSQYKLIYRQGRLEEGSINLFETNEQYLIGQLSNDKLVLSKTDMSIEKSHPHPHQ